MELGQAVELHLHEPPKGDPEVDEFSMFYPQHRKDPAGVALDETQRLEPLAGAKDVGDVRFLAKPQVLKSKPCQASERIRTAAEELVELLREVEEIGAGVPGDVLCQDLKLDDGASGSPWRLRWLCR